MESQPDYSRTGEGQGQSSLSPEYMYVNLGLQGYQVSDDEINMDLVTFRAHYANSGGSVEYVLRFWFECTRPTMCSRNQLNFFTNSRENHADQIFVFFSDEKSVGVKTMRKYALSSVLYSVKPMSLKAARYFRGKIYHEGYHHFSWEHDPLRTQSKPSRNE